MAVPIKSQESHALVTPYHSCYQHFVDNGSYQAQLVKLDNEEVSQDLVSTIKNDNLDYQLASPGGQWQNPAERCIQDFKDHFISI